MYCSSAKSFLLLVLFSAAFPLFAKHNGSADKIEKYCATNAWVFPVYEDVRHLDDNGTYFIPLIHNEHQKYPLILNVYDLTQKDNALALTLRNVLSNIEQVLTDEPWRFVKNIALEKFKNSRLLGLIVMDCGSSHARYTFVSADTLETKFVAGLPYANFLRARSTQKRFAQEEITYAIEFFNGDRTQQEALIKEFNAFFTTLLKASPASTQVTLPAIDGLRTSFDKEEL